MKALLVFFYWLSPLVPVAVTVAAYPARYASIQDAVPMVLGALAYTWLMAQLVLSARIPFIERRFGLDRLLLQRLVVGTYE
jgi:predicted ferric reductase